MTSFPVSPDQLERSPDVELEFVRSSGPGGQNVNKVSTAVRLRFAVRTTSLLPEDVRLRLILRSGRRMTVEGDLIVEARRYRTQERNRADALLRLSELIAAAWRPPLPRRPTRPTRAARQRRLDRKRRRGAVKQGRKTMDEGDE